VSIGIGMVLGVPLTYAFACHIHKLMQQ